MMTGEGILAQIESNKSKTTYTTLTKKILQDAFNKIADNPQKDNAFCITLNLFDALCFELTYLLYPDYEYTVKYHKRIKVYEFRFYKKYKQNVEFRECYNSKYEKIK